MPSIKLQTSSESAFVNEEPHAEAKPVLMVLFEAEESALVRFACSLTGRRAVAEEIVQEAFCRLHRHWDAVQKPRPWIYRTVRNLALTHLRDHAREREMEDPSEENLSCDSMSIPDEVLSRLEAMGMLRVVMKELDEKDRRLVDLKYMRGLSYAEIGRELNLSVSNVGFRLHHVLKAMGQSLRRAGLGGSRG